MGKLAEEKEILEDTHNKELDDITETAATEIQELEAKLEQELEKSAQLEVDLLEVDLEEI